MDKNIIVEVCAGSVEDCMIAYEAGADRIELNSGLFLGGLTPSYAQVKLASEKVNIPIISMVRPRGGGFHYSSLELETMFMDAKELIKLGSAGLAFGFLKEDYSIDVELTKEMVELCHELNAEAVFHRAFDLVEDPFLSIEILIDCGVDRVLTSGLKDTAINGKKTLKALQSKYGNKIEILAGSGINHCNVDEIINDCLVNQVHGSFKTWYQDKTSENENVSYAYSKDGSHEGVSLEKLGALIKKVR